jgi:hypothetical protein
VLATNQSSDKARARSSEATTPGRDLARPEMTTSEWIADTLVEQGVSTVYEVVGGMIAVVIDALYRDGRVRIVSCHHEQAAGFSAMPA